MPYQTKLADLRKERDAQAERLRELKEAALEATTEESRNHLAPLITAATMSLSDLDILMEAFTERQEQATRS